MKHDILMPTKLVTRRIAELLPYARNARVHSDQQVAELAASMVEFGYTNPILTADDGILAGHGRVLALHLLGQTRAPTIDLSHLTPIQRKAYILADNKLALNSDWDPAMLRLELQELQAEGFDLSLTGFGLEEIELLLEPEIVPPANDPNDVPELPATAHSVPGDIWICGPHKVMCGDSLAISDWDALLGNERADIAWTDPPYNVKYEGKTSAALTIRNDDMADAQFHDFLLGAFSALFSVMKAGAAIYVAHSDREAYPFHAAFRKSGFKFSSCVIWKKNALIPGGSPYQSIHEPILFGWKPGKAHRWFGGRKQTSVKAVGADTPFEQMEDGRWIVRAADQTFIVSGEALVEKLESSIVFADNPWRAALHPTMKPVELITQFLVNSARSNDIVVDGFSGSGSTMIAAEQVGMCARLMEVDPCYVDVICRRYYKFTGRHAVHAETGEQFPSPPVEEAA